MDSICVLVAYQDLRKRLLGNSLLPVCRTISRPAYEHLAVFRRILQSGNRQQSQDRWTTVKDREVRIRRRAPLALTLTCYPILVQVG
jgi:hypothetical protein